jgi:phenylalanyl-tRNA synthetase beta chain
MKVSLQWLREFVDFDLSPEETAKQLRSLGFDTASLSKVGAGVSGVVTAKVESREKHPNADKLSLCRVFDGSTRFRVVCGAPNVAAGQTVPLARVGAKLPGGVEIKPAVIRGEESQGMLCSTRELGLSEDHSGILILPDGTPLGEDVNKTLLLDDAVLDIEVMPNRPDMLSHWGVAREISAALRKPLKMPDTSIPDAPQADLVKLEEKSLCSRYIGRAFEGVKVGPSPLWMKLRLERCGIRSINNLVDITNYVLMELGHPMHVFDRDVLAGGRVVARLGRAGESLVCLDGINRRIDGRLVIADDAKPQAVAGVMGGAPSAVNEKTTQVLLESAHFLPAHVRATRRRLNIVTESSFRFERGTDREMAALASRRGTRLILDLGGGRLVGEQDAAGDFIAKAVVRVDPARVEALLGFPVPSVEVKESMERLGFSVREEGGEFVLTAPPHRQDVRETADVAEEVGRLAGFDRVPVRLRAASQDLEPLSAERGLLLEGRSFLAGRGFCEAQNAGLVSKAAWGALGGAADGLVELENPLSVSGEYLAPSLLPGLLSNAQVNRRRGVSNVRLFEAARTFREEGGGVRESLKLAFVAEGNLHDPHWKMAPRALEYWDLKSWVEGLLGSWRISAARLQVLNAPAFLHPSEAQVVLADDVRAGVLGRLHPGTAGAWDLSPDTFVAELDLTALSGAKRTEVRYRGLILQPALIRDFSLLFPGDVPWGDIASFVMKEADHAESVELFDVFKGKGLPEGRRSLAFRVAFRRSDRALTDAEAGKIQEKLLAGLETRFQAVLRK